MQFLKFWESQQPILHVKIELFYYYRKNPKKILSIKYIEFFLDTNQNKCLMHAALSKNPDEIPCDK